MIKETRIGLRLDTETHENCNKCNMYYLCDRKPIKIEKENETK